MPKLNFNIPISTNGEIEMKFKLDRTKMQVAGENLAKPEPMLDENGNILQEPVMLGPDFLSSLANTFYLDYQDEKDMGIESRLKRGRLSKKLADRSQPSTMFYSFEEVKILLDILVKSRTSPLIIEQVYSVLDQDA